MRVANDALTVESPIEVMLRAGDADALRARLATDRVHVWSHRLDLDAPVVERLRALLAADEIERADRYRFLADRQRFAVSRAVMRLVLGRYVDCAPALLRFDYRCACRDPHCSPTRRKPVLAAPDGEPRVQFNLSHSGTLVVLAVALHDVGIDVESMRPDVDWRSLADEALTTSDASLVHGLADEAGRLAFYQGWTRKEALLKAMGRGFAAMPDEQPDLLTMDRGARVWAHDGRDYTFVELAGLPPGHVGALVTTGTAPGDAASVHPCDVGTLGQSPLDAAGA